MGLAIPEIVSSLKATGTQGDTLAVTLGDWSDSLAGISAKTSYSETRYDSEGRPFKYFLTVGEMSDYISFALLHVGALFRGLDATAKDVDALDDAGQFINDMDLGKLQQNIIDYVGTVNKSIVDSIVDIYKGITSGYDNLSRPSLASVLTSIGTMETDIRAELVGRITLAEGMIESARQDITDELKITTNTIIARLNESAAMVSGEIDEAFKKTRDAFTEVTGQVSKFLADAPEDIARRIFLYFMRFVFKTKG